MTTLVVPHLDEEPWPTLGPQVCDFVEEFGRYGPGELKGERYVVTADFRAWLYRAYEVFPADHRLAGRRRFKRCYDEERKGTAKTEKAMLVAMAESHPDGPVRCDGFDADGRPVGVGVRSPYIPLVSYTVEQTEDLGYNVLRQILEESPIGDDYDVGLERILLLDRRGREAGKIQALAGSPNARDGARTTHQHFDEPHRMTLPRLIRAHSTMVENTYKRVGADAWTNYTSTAGDVNEESVARDMRQYAEAIDRGEVDDPRLFFFSRFAPDEMPMETPEQVRAFLLEASGPNASWSGDIDALVSRWFEPKTDRAYYRRVWGNQWVAGGERAFDGKRFAELAVDKPQLPADGTLIVLFFDGSRWNDHTGLVGTVVESGYQFVVGHWVPGEGGVDVEDVNRKVASAHDRWDVWRMYCDPPHWEESIDAWKGRYGDKNVVDWFTNRAKIMGEACRRYHAAIGDGLVSHDGDEAFVQHVGNAHKRLEVYEVEEDGEKVPLWTIRKARSDSDDKIDLAVCGVGSWEARGDAIAAGAKPKRKYRVAGF